MAEPHSSAFNTFQAKPKSILKHLKMSQHVSETFKLLPPRLVKALEEAKRRLARAQKVAHAAEVAAAELRGKNDAEKEAARAEVRAGGGRLGGQLVYRLNFWLVG